MKTCTLTTLVVTWDVDRLAWEEKDRPGYVVLVSPTLKKELRQGADRYGLGFETLAWADGALWRSLDELPAGVEV